MEEALNLIEVQEEEVVYPNEKITLALQKGWVWFLVPNVCKFIAPSFAHYHDGIFPLWQWCSHLENSKILWPLELNNL